MDKIYLRNIREKCIIGVRPEERLSPQDVEVSVAVCLDLQKACRSDAIEDTADYSVIVKQIKNYISHSSFFLCEALAQGIADTVLSGLASGVRVTVCKPGALGETDAVIEITRGKYE